MEGGTKELYWVTSMFSTLIGRLVVQGYIFFRTLQTLLLRPVHFTECKYGLKVGGGMAPGSTEKAGLGGSG